MTNSSEVIAKLKKASNYTKLAMRREGPHSFKQGQGALIKVIYKFGDGSMYKDDAKKKLGWRGSDVRAVAKKAADNGYLTIESPKDAFKMTLTDLGTEIIKKRLEAEGKAADEVLAGLSDEEKAQLAAICDKICTTAEDMGISYSLIQKKRGCKYGKKHHKRGGTKVVVVLEGHGACSSHGHGRKHSKKCHKDHR